MGEILRRIRISGRKCLKNASRYRKLGKTNLRKIEKNTFPDILTWIGEFRPGNKTIWVVFYVESEFSGPRAQFLSPDRVFWKNVPYKIFENF